MTGRQPKYLKESTRENLLDGIDHYMEAKTRDLGLGPKRWWRYAQNMSAVLLTFAYYGLVKHSGPMDEATREMAVRTLIDIQDYMGGTRLPISDHFAVVPNYYAYETIPSWDTIEEDIPSKAVDKYYKQREESGAVTGSVMKKPMTIRYFVGMELVIRDFRNYEAECDTLLAKGAKRYLEHPTGSRLPPARPSKLSSVYDIPVGLITKMSFDWRNGMVKMHLRGVHGERMTITLKQPARKYIALRLVGQYALKDLIEDIKVPENLDGAWSSNRSPFDDCEDQLTSDADEIELIDDGLELKDMPDILDDLPRGESECLTQLWDDLERLDL